MTTEQKHDPMAKARAAKAAKAAERQRIAAGALGDGSVLAAEDDFEVMDAYGRSAAPVQDARGADTMGRMELFRRRMAAQGPVTTTEDLTDAVGESGEFDRSVETPGVEHTSAGLVWLYSHEVWGWERRRYSRNGISEVIAAGKLPYCGDCGSSTCPGMPNECPKGERYAYRICPVPGCNKNNGGPKKFFDLDRSVADATPDAEDDPFLIRDMAYARSTPEQRVKIALDDHIRYYHTTYAAALGLNNIQPQMVQPS